MLDSETLAIRGATSIPAFGDNGTRVASGKKRQREDFSAGPEDDPSPVVNVQRCLPLRRQQAGNPESSSDAKTAGGISEKLKRPSKAVASARRTTAWYFPRVQFVKAVHSSRKPLLNVLGVLEAFGGNTFPKSL